MPRWEIPALWSALFMGLAVLGYALWYWPFPSTAQAHSQAEPIRSLRPVSPPDPGTGRPSGQVPWEDASAQAAAAPTLQVLPLAAGEQVAPTPAASAAPNAAIDRFIVGLAHDARQDVSTAGPPAINLRREARQVAAAAHEVQDSEPASPALPTDTGLPLFPGAQALPEQSTRSADGSATVTLVTRSPLAAVVNFYRQGLPESAEGDRQVVAAVAQQAGLDVREIDTRQRTMRRVQVAEVDSLVFIRLSLIRTP